MSGTTQEAVHRWLDEAATAMGGKAALRKDALLELESAIYDRIDEKSEGREPSTQEIEEVLEAMGEPAEVANSYAPAQPLIAPYQTRTFLLNVAALFAVHMLFVIGATVAGGMLEFTPFRIAPLADPENALSILARAVTTLFFDIGLLLCFFALMPRLQRLMKFPRTSLIVRPNLRRNIETACFFALVLVVFNWFRDDLFALYVSSGDGSQPIPFLGNGFSDNLILFNVWIGFAIGRELLYSRFGESRITLGVDVTSNLLGLGFLLSLVASRDLVNFSASSDQLSDTAKSLDALLNSGFMVLAVLAAAVIAARLVYRVFRLCMVRRG